MNLKKIAFFFLSALLIVVFILIIGLYFLFKSSLPEREGEIEIMGINSPIEIFFDDKGIPQIWAENEEDAWFAVGWLHAGDRLFQMELTRRVASGSLSEILGDITLSFDRKQRLIGHRIIAGQDVSNLDPVIVRYLESYSAGINQWVNHTTALPFEFQVLNLDFEPWSPIDCLSIFSFQTWFIDELQNNDDLFLNIEKKKGIKSAEEIIRPYPEDAPKTVPQIEDNQKNTMSTQPKYASKSDLNEFIYHYLFPGGQIPFLMTKSSNAWAVSGSRSRSGNALFSSDPHLELSRLPQFWYIVGVHTKDKSLETLGITSPGLPLIAMGHNGKISWAFTAGGTDVTDQYIEQVNPNNPNEYLVGEAYRPYDIRFEYIKISGRETVDTLKIKTTRHGPVIEENDSLNQVVALRWAGFDFSPSEGLKSGFRMLKCNNFFEFQNLVTEFGALDANWMYADREGNIGYQLGAPIPIRINNTGQARIIGWDGNSEWSGYYPLDKTPHSYNPLKGWLATCNNKPDEGNLDYSLQGNFADARIWRISELLSGMGKMSTREMKLFQKDFKSTGLVPWKNEAVTVLKSMEHSEWIERLDTWNEFSEIESKETALIETWIVILKIKTFEDDFGDLTKKLLNKLLYRERNFYKIYVNRNSKWFDDVRTQDRVESRDEIAVEAMREALSLVGARSWGDVQTLTMSHPMAAVPILSTILSLERGPFSRAGTSGSLNNTISFWDDEDSFKGIAGPSWRFVMDFENIDEAQMVIPAGQSGNPLDPHFFDFYELWDRGEYWTVPFSEDKIKEKAMSKLLLIPRETD
jgi:penicillin amidase